jgi:hypothetical protein
LVVTLTVFVGLGACAVAAGIMVPSMLGRIGAWLVVMVGLIALVASLVGLGTIETRRDRLPR